MPLTPGSQLGSYRIGSLRGKGGMGEVYRAQDLRLDRNVAIKILPEHLANDPEIGRPPFGYTFDPDELARLYHQGASGEELARIGIPDNQ